MNDINNINNVVGDELNKILESINLIPDDVRKQIKIDKENLFQLLKTDQIVDSVKNNAALKVSLSIQSLDILTFDHFKKVRALCTEEQKPEFNQLIQKMVNSVNNTQKGIKPSIKEGMPPADTK